MTYSIFGEEEQIFGYKGLRIDLKFNAHDMRPNLQILYTRKFKAVGETEATDVKATLQDFLPKSAHLFCSCSTMLTESSCFRILKGISGYDI